MNAGGWLLFGVTWGIIIILATFCFMKVFSKKELK